MDTLAIIVGVVLVVSVLADLLNTLVATQTKRRAAPEETQFFEDLYRDLAAHGLTLVPRAEARRRTAAWRNLYAARASEALDREA